MAIGINTVTTLAQQSRKIGFDKELRMKASLESIYTALKGHYNTEKKTIPNAIYMTISDKTLSDSWKARITMKYPLRGPGVFGNEFAIGKEEQTETKACEIYRNNCRKVVSVPGYGIEKLDADYLGLFEKHIDDLAVWNKDQEDLEIHQALLQTFGETLSKVPASPATSETAANCAVNWNPNIFVAGKDANGNIGTDLPAYSPVSNTYSANIGNILNGVNSGKGLPLTAPVLSQISNYALRKRIERLDIPGLPGGKGYVLTISELQAMHLGDPKWSDRNMGSLWLQKAALPEKIINWPGVLGAYKDLLIVVDVRMPVVSYSYIANASTVNAHYVQPGDNDQRPARVATTVAPRPIDVAILHGKGALWKWEPEPLHSIEQMDDYGKLKGVGTARVWGIGLPIYKYDIVTPATNPPAGTSHTPSSGVAIEQYSSAVVLCGLPDGTISNTLS